MAEQSSITEVQYGIKYPQSENAYLIIGKGISSRQRAQKRADETGGKLVFRLIQWSRWYENIRDLQNDRTE